LGNSKLASGLLILLAVVIIAGTAYFISSYATNAVGAAAGFITSSDFTALQACGVTPPAEFAQMGSDLTTWVLPFLYIGLPMLFLVIAAIMFAAGYYYHKGKETEVKKREPPRP